MLKLCWNNHYGAWNILEIISLARMLKNHGQLKSIMPCLNKHAWNSLEKKSCLKSNENRVKSDIIKNVNVMKKIVEK